MLSVDSYDCVSKMDPFGSTAAKMPRRKSSAKQNIIFTSPQMERPYSTYSCVHNNQWVEMSQ